MSLAPRLTVGVASGSLLALAVASIACSGPPRPPPPPQVPDPPARDALVAAYYPSLAQIYQGAQGIYRGCGPNGNVCHNARQYPNMNTLGALALNVGQPCNQLQDDPTHMDDWCERQGDTVRIGGVSRLLAYIQRLSEATETVGSRWAIVVQGDFPMLTAQTDLNIVRERPGVADVNLISFDARQLQPDPARPNAVFVQLGVNDERDDRALTRAGVPAERDAIQFGDANRNGTFGVGLGNLLINPGHPERSYLIRRLIDPSAGPLMPLANCCSWSKESLRALWCWIANLRPDGSNAMDPIDYTVCPEGPVENVEYPQPGPMCENVGLCPVRARDPVPDIPTWANIYSNIVVPRCGGSMCHRSANPAGSLDLGTSDVAYEQLLHSMMPRVVPGNPAMSLLYERITLTCPAGAETCRRMPQSQAPLPANEISLINRWILSGARQDGMAVDGGGVDGGDVVTATDVRDVSPPDVVSDIGATDTGPSDTPAPPVDVEMDAAAE